MPEPIPPYVQFTVDVSLPESATEEQRERFRRAFEERGASPSFTVTVSLPPTATDDQRRRFAEALQEACLDDAPPIDTKPIDR